MTHLVVMEAVVAGTPIWAWCRVTEGPGFDSIEYTLADGQTPHELDGPTPRLERHLFTLALFETDDLDVLPDRGR